VFQLKRDALSTGEYSHDTNRTKPALRETVKYRTFLRLIRKKGRSICNYFIVYTHITLLHQFLFFFTLSLHLHPVFVHLNYEICYNYVIRGGEHFSNVDMSLASTKRAQDIGNTHTGNCTPSGNAQDYITHTVQNFT
jgi:hypothetical protein